MLKGMLEEPVYAFLGRQGESQSAKRSLRLASKREALLGKNPGESRSGNSRKGYAAATGFCATGEISFLKKTFQKMLCFEKKPCGVRWVFC